MWYHRSAIGWCEKHHVPLLGPRCDLCNDEGRPVTVSWRGEIRPLTEAEAIFFNSLLVEIGLQPTLAGFSHSRFFCHWVEDVHRKPHVVNVISGGHILLRVLFFLDPVTYRVHWKVAPTLAFARAFPGVALPLGFPLPLAPSTIAIPSLSSSYAVLAHNSFVAIAAQKGEGRYRVLGLGTPNPSLGYPSSLETFVAANSSFLKRVKEEKIAFIRQLASSSRLPLLVSLSGGKDSTIVLDLVAKAGIEARAVFVDTRNEFPETLVLMQELQTRYGEKIPIDVVKAPQDLFSLWTRLGPPTWDNRWCCKTQKFLPLESYLRENFPGGVLTLTGTRTMESFRRERRLVNRQKLGGISNPYLRLQIQEVPVIGDWNSLTVWLYLLSEDVPLNSLYLEGFHRLGCWACPAAPLSYFDLLRRYRSNLFEHLIHALEKAGNRSYLPRCIKTVHAWKEGHLDRHVKIMKEVTGKSVIFRPIPPDAMHYLIPLQRAGISVDRRGDSVYVDENAGIGLVERQLHRALACIGCGKCISICPNGAIQIKDGHCRVIAESCNGCLDCVRMECPALKFPLSYTHCTA